MWRDERGMALVLVLLCAMLFLALGGALVTVVSSEAIISATFRESAVALSAADAAIVRVLPDLGAAPDLNAILTGTVASSFVDEPPPPAPRRLPDGTSLDLAAATSVERCGQIACTEAQMDAVTDERPWGTNNARWQRYGSGWLRDLTPQAADAPHAYVVVWIGDDPLETDGDPLTDDGDVNAPGHDVVLLRAAAYAAYSARRRIEVVARRDGGRVRITSWREIR
jgi:hypothetical protein